jgi:hypothetical protein
LSACSSHYFVCHRETFDFIARFFAFACVNPVLAMRVLLLAFGAAAFLLMGCPDRGAAAEHGYVAKSRLQLSGGASVDPLTAAADGWKEAVATVFWVGEGASASNGFIANLAGAWDRGWVNHFGGVDNPRSRCGFKPCRFQPRENPFYVALPYDDMDEQGRAKQSALRAGLRKPGQRASALKNRWIAVKAKGRVCYGQWEDVGPYESDDLAYVFGNARKPRNGRDVRAGIDLSPAMRSCLRVADVARVAWRHVDASVVPAGPWRDVVTNRRGP